MFLGRQKVKKFNFLCSLIVILTMTVCIVAFAQNITLRTTAAYTFYFNDTYVVSSVSSEYVNSEMSDMIAKFFNSWNPKEFQIYEDTGYDIEGIFDKKDSHNMLAIKYALDISFVLGVVCLIITIAIYRHFLRSGYKQILRNRYKISSILVFLILIAEMIILNTKKGMGFISDILGLQVLENDSNLLTLLGGDFIGLADNFLFGLTVLLFAGVTYVVHVLTKSPKIFF